jgi:hypothetical protein
LNGYWLSRPILVLMYLECFEILDGGYRSRSIRRAWTGARRRAETAIRRAR